MKNNKLHIFVLIAVMIFISSCSTQDEEVTEENLENYEYSFQDPESGEIHYFKTFDELIASLKGTEYYEAVKKKHALLAKEIEIIEKNKLYDLPDDDIKVKNYIKSLENRSSSQLKTAQGSSLYDPSNCRGRRIARGDFPRIKNPRGRAIGVFNGRKFYNLMKTIRFQTFL
ncbi:hypothetical protein [Aquimarina sp. RZ0]|uniref:hypothetical protein n=1 Tax=Aquimarina sp. RZ0 TaxID=2607730 RepID=UPI0011F18151|nr:hypothetical protein [Aquimarina sp. RZ0]KAA1247359.1 hypothetical protein F0000_04230 [Aquimarina sp. RZ0]